MRTNTEKTLGAAFKARRLALKLPLRIVAAQAQIDVSQLSKIERGIARTEVPKYERIAKSLGWTPAQMWSLVIGKRAA